MNSEKKTLSEVIKMTTGIIRRTGVLPVAFEKPKRIETMDSSLARIKLPPISGKKTEYPKAKQSKER